MKKCLYFLICIIGRCLIQSRCVFYFTVNAGCYIALRQQRSGRVIMKSKRSSIVWILLSFIILFTGMCSQIERTDSFLSAQRYMAEADRIETVKNDTLYIGNCTGKLITGLRDTFQRIRRGQGRLSLRSYAEFLWLKEVLQLLLSFCITAAAVFLPTQNSNTAILNYIHKQDGEK